MRLSIVARFFIASILAFSPSAFGWGADGHRIVAMIATARLTPEAAAHVKQLLGNATLADVASWADQVRRQREETAPWHYVDIPVEAATFDEQRDGRDGNNVIDAVRKFEKALTATTQPTDERVEDLKFLVHFVGDIHQPLHCADRNGDKGGNGRLVFFLDQPRAVNLHSVWDTSIIRHQMGTSSVTVFASGLNLRISKAQADEWSKGTPEDWANQSHAIAVGVAYAGVPADGPPPKLGDDYVKQAQATTDEQLERAGVRLATVLNEILK